MIVADFRSLSRNAFAAAGLLLIGGFVCLAFDAEIALHLVNPAKLHSSEARGLAAERFISLPGDVRRLVTLSEAFAHGTGVAAIVLTVYVLSPQSRPSVWLLVVCCVVGGVSALLVKYAIPRTRPMFFDFATGILQTFEPAARSEYAVRSTPSAHAATAASLAVSLSALFPRGAVLFAGFAALASLQRVQAAAHFPSDVCWGAALGSFLSGLIVLRTGHRIRRNNPLADSPLVA